MCSDHVSITNKDVTSSNVKRYFFTFLQRMYSCKVSSTFCISEAESLFYVNKRNKSNQNYVLNYAAQLNFMYLEINNEKCVEIHYIHVWGS